MDITYSTHPTVTYELLRLFCNLSILHIDISFET
jgi:hypothetical protein